MTDRRGSAGCCRMCTVILIISKLALIISVMIFASLLISTVFDGIDKAQSACQAAGKTDCVDLGHMITKYMKFGYIGMLSVVGTFAFFDLIGCFGAAFANRLFLCIFVFFNVFFVVLLLVPFGGSAALAHMSGDKNNSYVQQFDSLTMDSLHSLEKLLEGIKNKANRHHVNRQYPLTKDQIEFINSLLGQEGKLAMPPEDPDTGQLRESMLGIEEVVSTHSDLIKKAQSAVDWLQERLKCCGISTYHNWGEFCLRNIVPNITASDESGATINWLLIRLTDKNGSQIQTWDQKCVFDRYQCYVPKSCCKHSYQVKCDEKHPQNADVKKAEAIFKTPCKDAFIEKIHHIASVVAMLLAGIIVLIILSIVASCCTRNQLSDDHATPMAVQNGPMPKFGRRLKHDRGKHAPKEPPFSYQRKVPTPKPASPKTTTSLQMNDQSKSSKSQSGSMMGPPKRLLPPLQKKESATGASNMLKSNLSATGKSGISAKKEPIKGGLGAKGK